MGGSQDRGIFQGLTEERRFFPIILVICGYLLAIAYADVLGHQLLPVLQVNKTCLSPPFFPRKLGCCSVFFDTR